MGRTMRSSCRDFTTGGALAAAFAADLDGRSESGVSSLVSRVVIDADARGGLDGAVVSVPAMARARAGRRVVVAVRVPDDVLTPTATCEGGQFSAQHQPSAPTLASKLQQDPAHL